MRGIEPRPRRWERRILATRPHGIDKTKLPNEQITGQVLLSWYRLWRYLALLGARELHGFIIHDRHISPNTTGLPLEKRNLCENFCAPVRGIEPRPRRWKRRILATRPQGMVPFQIGKSSIFLTRQKLFRKGCAYLWGCLSFYRTLGVLERVFSERLLKETVRIGVFLSHYKTYSRAGNRTLAAAVRAPNPSH